MFSCIVFMHRPVCERLKPEHGISYSVLGNSALYRNLKASRRWQRDSNRSQLYGGGDRSRQAVFPDSFANGTVVDSGELDRPAKMRCKSTRSSFTSTRELRYGSQEENCIVLQQEVLRCT